MIEQLAQRLSEMEKYVYKNEKSKIYTEKNISVQRN